MAAVVGLIATVATVVNLTVVALTVIGLMAEAPFGDGAAPERNLPEMVPLHVWMALIAPLLVAVRVSARIRSRRQDQTSAPPDEPQAPST